MAVPIDEIRLSLDMTGLAVINAALGFVMFGVALDLTVEDFVKLAKDPRSPGIGLFCQFVLLPALACPLALAIAPTPSMALGMMLIAACPGGNVSNVITQLAGGRVSVSVGMTAVSTFAAMITTPLNLSFWGSLHPSTAALVTEVQLSFWDVFGTVAMVLGVPCALGMSVARWLPDIADRLRKPMRWLAGLFFVVVLVGAFAANTGPLMMAIRTVFVPVATLNALALSLGYGAAWALGLPEGDRRAVSIEVGIQNAALGLVLVLNFFDGLGGMAVVAGWWGIWHIIAGLTLAGAWSWSDRRRATAAAAG